DSGVFGELSLVQTNFDVTDFPESFEELITGRAFRGAGQTFNATLSPGTELFQYVMSLTDPHLFDTEYSGSIAGFWRTRVYDQYDERQYGTSLTFGRQLGDIWNISLRNRFENVKLYNIEASAPTADFEDAGPNSFTVLGVALQRTTIPRVSRP